MSLMSIAFTLLLLAAPLAPGSPDLAGKIYLPMVAAPPGQIASVRTFITNIDVFLDRCPNNDRAYAKIRQDFIIRRDGVIVGAVPCTAPYSTMPIKGLTDELIALQTLRIAYYMDTGQPNFLPWTSKSLYAWLATAVGGINLKTQPGQLYCCDVIDGRRYISQSIQSDEQRNYKRDWMGISNSLAYYAHEARHADPGSPGHTTGCPGFTNPSGPKGCDATYDLHNLGSYGVQYWLNLNWLTGYINVGISCTPATAQEYINWHLSGVNGYRDRFVSSRPPLVPMPSPPYGGPCYDQ